MTSIRANPLLHHPLPLKKKQQKKQKLVQQTHGALQTALFMKEVTVPHMVGTLKYTRQLPRLLKMHCGRLYVRA